MIPTKRLPKSNLITWGRPVSSSKMNPPTKAPTMPSSIVIMQPPGSRPGMSSLAMIPAMRPKKIQATIPTTPPPRRAEEHICRAYYTAYSAGSDSACAPSQRLRTKDVVSRRECEPIRRLRSESYVPHTRWRRVNRDAGSPHFDAAATGFETTGAAEPDTAQVEHGPGRGRLDGRDGAHLRVSGPQRQHRAFPGRRGATDP